MKRPDRELYIPPVFRSSFDEDKMEYDQEKYASEASNRQPYSLRNRDSSQRRSTNINRRQVRFASSSSSSNPRSISDKSCEDDDSSDFEECCSLSNEPMNDQENNMRTNEKNSSDQCNEEGTGKPTQNNHDIKTTAKSQSNMLFNFESNETKHDRGLFFNSDDSSISDIEAMIDSHMEKGRVLTSTPNSDIVEQRILEAAKYDSEEESGLESTLLDQSNIREITLNTNRNKCDYNFEIYQDPPSVMSQETNFSEIFGNNYIPPPVAPPISVSRLPPIHRLTSPVLSPHGISQFRHVSPQKVPQLHTQLRHPRLPLPSSLQSHSSLPCRLSTNSSNSLHMPSVPRYVFTPSLQCGPLRALNPPRFRYSITPPHFPQERFNPPHSPQDASSSLYLHRRTPEFCKQDDSFYIPPPVPPPQQKNGGQQIRNLNLSENEPSRQPYSTSMVNKIIFDDEIWPQNQDARK
ncbi:unnamed protein product [Larinioides sclopetarius]|uniref:Uncharacterized protein n=1 Tax=Larinioides sclopetarius TaxID=280406 RepID=A0AAV2AIH3_9ARAC